MNEKDAILDLDNQLCFPLYVVSKEIIRKYNPILKKYDLTYTQYIVLLAMWKRDNVLVKELGHEVYLDSGTLTPLLKKLEQKGYISRVKGNKDERELYVKLTEKGKAFKEKAIEIPLFISKCINISPEQAIQLKIILNELMKDYDYE